MLCGEGGPLIVVVFFLTVWRSWVVGWGGGGGGGGLAVVVVVVVSEEEESVGGWIVACPVKFGYLEENFSESWCYPVFIGSHSVMVFT